MRRILSLIIVLLPLCAFADSGWLFHAVSTRSPRMALANPARLAGSAPRAFGLELPGVGAAASNNSFSVGFWNTHIAGDSYWDRGETRSILAQIPRSGLALQADLAAPVLGLRYRSWALNVTALAAARANVPKAAAQMALVGAYLNQNYSFAELAGQSVALSDYALSWGRRIPQRFVPELSGGASFHYYQGFFYTNAVSSGGGIYATNDLIQGSGAFEAALATGGSGFGMDLGLLARLSPRWQVELAAQQIGATMVWRFSERHLSSFSTNAAGLELDSLDQREYTDRVFASTDTTLKGGQEMSRLPATLRTGARFTPNAHWTLAALAGWQTLDSPLGPAGGEAGAAIEYRPWRWLAFDGGAVLGGPHERLFTMGGGLRFGAYELELSVSHTGGIGNAARGVGAGISQRVLF